MTSVLAPSKKDVTRLSLLDARAVLFCAVICFSALAPLNGADQIAKSNLLDAVGAAVNELKFVSGDSSWIADQIESIGDVSISGGSAFLVFGSNGKHVEFDLVESVDSIRKRFEQIAASQSGTLSYSGSAKAGGGLSSLAEGAFSRAEFSKRSDKSLLKFTVYAIPVTERCVGFVLRYSLVTTITAD